jgi:hypothetical protein
MGSLMTIERALRSPLDWSGGTRSAMATIQTRSRDPKFYIDLIDSILHEIPMPDEAARLDQILVSGGSVWKVVLLDSPAFQYGLERRVDEAVAEAARHVIAESGKAGKHLGLAWRAAYGVNPNPTEAYWESVRAVEAAGKPIVSPNSDITTLGTMIRDMAAAPTKWRMTMHPKVDPKQPKAAVDPIETLIAMMRLLWKSHTDRHGTPDENVEVSEPEAVGALHLAVTLVQWFSAGTVKRV